MNNLSINYHDWYLLAVRVDLVKHGLELTLGYHEKRSSVRFVEVKQCLLNQFTLGNVVFEIYIYSGEFPIEKMFSNKMFLETIGDTKESSYFKKMVAGIENGSLLYVEIQPSIGCHGGIICKSIEEHALPDALPGQYYVQEP